MKSPQNSTRGFVGAAVIVVAALLQACAHPITLNGDLSKVNAGSAAKVDRKVGLYVSDDDRKREVTTPGGGGDKVSYFPYRDLEPGVYKALSEVFVSVTKVSGPSDPKVQSDVLGYVITPAIKTSTWSDSVLTWPPTLVSIDLTCKVTDPSGNLVKEVAVNGEGRAEFSEFKSNFSLAGKRASEDTLAKLVKALREQLSALP